MEKINIRTLDQLIQYYQLDRLIRERKAVINNNDSLVKMQKEITDYIKSVTKDIDDLHGLVDGYVSAWYYNGEPTLENYPAKDWETLEQKLAHIGDFYYDKDTGYGYRFILDGELYYNNEPVLFNNQKIFINSFAWESVKDKTTIEALALANAAKDTADGKRRTFVEEPKPPYDTGDIWFADGKLLRCAISRSEGDLNLSDWIDDLKYTDDTAALKTQAQLDEFKQSVSETYITSANLYTTIDGVHAEVTSQLTQINDATREELKTVKNIAENSLSSTEYQLTFIKERIENGVNKVITNTGYRFDDEGLMITKEGQEMSNKVDNTGIYIKRDAESILIANNEGVDAINLRYKRYMNHCDIVRTEKYKGNRLGFFYIGS